MPDEILLEVKGFVGKDDPRLAALAEAAGDAIARIAPIGGFANPIVLPLGTVTDRAMTLAPKPGVMDIEVYVPGRSEAAGAARVFKLSSNESPFGPSPESGRRL